MHNARIALPPTVRHCLSALLGAALLMASAGGFNAARAASTPAEIDAKVDAALARLQAEVPNADAVLAKAQGVLVFAKVIKAGLVIAGEGGEGALR
ncbi:MAG: hypothetical protein L6Q83_01275, partial [Gammaproteobacteria bacterium]|nr:hypothetical protein [Gammaproteobacteria bacterium]